MQAMIPVKIRPTDTDRRARAAKTIPRLQDRTPRSFTFGLRVPGPAVPKSPARGLSIRGSLAPCHRRL
ncbi:hypothetical protein CHELA1G11_10051 [Hyphomicrobiales bacterium]|nr:hypothetical protein CHELA1G11_10051 [Hyphomicrobiales bacterium]CAH1677414.1 hypothetical protein CHELA1G2_14258 [Hyphomicrobiales bacterium]